MEKEMKIEGEGESIQEQTLEHQSPINQNSPNSNIQIQEWEAKARIWLSALPNHQSNVTTDQVEAWINSNQVPLPEELRSLSPSQLYDKILTLIKVPSQSDLGKATPGHPARFQRTDQWIPVYAWLESLDKNEVVKSKEITEWLSENPNVKEKLYSRHSRYHLMHYVQKCHMKILKRQGKLQKASGSMVAEKFKPQAAEPISVNVTTKVLNNGVPTVAIPHSGTPSSNLLKNKDVSLAKRNEAFCRYQLFTELENHLSSLLSKQDNSTA